MSDTRTTAHIMLERQRLLDEQLRKKSEENAAADLAAISDNIKAPTDPPEDESDGSEVIPLPSSTPDPVSLPSAEQSAEVGPPDDSLRPAVYRATEPFSFAGYNNSLQHFQDGELIHDPALIDLLLLGNCAIERVHDKKVVRCPSCHCRFPVQE